MDQTSLAQCPSRPGNAKGVNEKVEKKLMGIVGPLRTFVCCCEEDAEHALKKAWSIWGDDVGDGGSQLA